MRQLLFSLALLVPTLAGCVVSASESQPTNIVHADPFVIRSADEFINGYKHPIELARGGKMFIHLRESTKEAVVTMVTYPDGKFRIHSSRIATEPEIASVFPDHVTSGFFFSYPKGKKATVFTGHTHPFEVINIDEMSDLRKKMMIERPRATGSVPPSIMDVLIACSRLELEDFLSKTGFVPRQVDHLDGVYDLNGLWLFEPNDSTAAQRCSNVAHKLLQDGKPGMFRDKDLLINEFGLTQAEAEWVIAFTDLQNRVIFVAEESQIEPSIDAYIEHVSEWGVDVSYDFY